MRMGYARTACQTLLIAIALVGHANLLIAQQPAPAVDFNRDVRPILADKCFTCHGPDENTREADLRLDIESEATAARDGSPAIVPGDLAASQLIERISSDDPDVRMPPADSGKTLSDRQIETLRRWVKEGAAWQKHWSFLPPARPPLPATRSANAENPIDQFIGARLQDENLTFSPAADRRTLLRRLYFDLTGLPPSPQQVQAFIEDKDPRAYEKRVDQLLASEHFGERMAIYWLDMVRYADTNGIHGDNHREHALYRDYVINAFNTNLPFDRFTTEQLAGDLLPESGREQRIASGYNRLNMTTREGGAQAKEYRAKYAADRVRNASTVWLGATLGCAQCHDHKFDPFTTKDFYRFAAFFDDLQETPVGTQQPTRILSAEDQAAVDRLSKEIQQLRRQLDQSTTELEAAQQAWEKEVLAQKTEWVPMEVAQAVGKQGAKLEVVDQVVQVDGANPDKETYTLTLRTSLPEISGLRLDVMPRDNLPSKGPGRAANGNFVVNEVTLQLDGKPIAFSVATADHSQKDWPIAGVIDGKPATGWAILPHVGKPHHAVFELAEKVAVGESGELTLAIVQDYGTAHTLGQFKVSATASARPVRADGQQLPAKVLAILEQPAGKRSDADKNELARHYRSIAPLLAPVRKQVAAHQAEIDKRTKAAPQLLIALTEKPRMTRVLPRGNWLDDSGEVVTPGTPEFLPPLQSDGSRPSRLDLARWIVDPNNPLTARVFVNRLWKLYFGKGLVRSLDDFGAQGSWPSHPRLLDWLAMEFVEREWNVKHMIKLIVMSRTYQQSSLVSPELRTRDPYNRLLARQGRFRLDAEMVRDNALAISGLLVTKLGGPSVKPYQPVGYWKHLNFPKRTYQHDGGESQYRRGLYTYWCRTFLHPSLLAFDAPSREECTVERPRSNTPLAALVLLNDPTYVEAARVFAERILREGGDSTEARLRYGMQQALARDPVPAELELLLALHHKHRAHFQQHLPEARALLGVGLRPASVEDAELAEVAAWTSIARVIFNLHETITRN